MLIVEVTVAAVVFVLPDIRIVLRFIVDVLLDVFKNELGLTLLSIRVLMSKTSWELVLCPVFGNISEWRVTLDA